MESRIQRLFLSLLLGALVVPAAFAGTKPQELELEPLVVREPERREVDVDELDNEDWEIGAFGGLMNVEDFGTDIATGVRAAYHVTEDFFVEGVYGRTTLGETSFELLSGGAQILSDDERDMTYYNVSVGWNVFPGESFIGGRWAFKGGMYLIGGIGSTVFGGDDRFTINAGIGYRMALTDWLALRVDIRDHFFESELLGTPKDLHNIEFTGGLTIFF